MTVCVSQFGNRLDDLLELVCSDVVGTTVEEVEEALQVLQEKSDACGQYQQLSFLTSECKMYPQLSSCAQYQVPTAFLSYVRVQNVFTVGFLWSVPTSFLSSEYKMYPQLGACGQYQ